MKEIVTTLTKKGQVTIPLEIRTYLGIKAKDKVAFSMDSGGIRLAPAKYTIEKVYGMVPPLNKPEEFKKNRKIALEEHARKIVRKMNK